MRAEEKKEAIRTYYRTLADAWGLQHWWPAQSPFEVIVGTYLTQNTAWTNVERALANLRAARQLSLAGMRRTPLAKLERLIRPAGYFRQKAGRLKTFVAFLDRRYNGSLSGMFSQPTPKLREELLRLNGVGPETADSILLYAGNHPVFVVDAYTRRILHRHGILPENTEYNQIRELFEDALARLSNQAFATSPSMIENGMQENDFDAGPRGAVHPPSRMSTAQRSNLAQVYNEMHGLIVGVGKNYCRKSQARCDNCPLQKFLPESRH